MKRFFTFLAIVLMTVAVSSCKNRNKNAKQAADYSKSTKQELVSEALKLDMATLIESAKKIKSVPFLQAKRDGKITLSDKEKMVKPDYLLDVNSLSGLVTLSQKYRMAGMLTSDKAIAELYDMSVTGYNEAIFKLLTDINDPALTEFYTLPSLDIESNKEAFSIFVDDEYKAGRINYFWEGVSAALVEQVFILTRDVDKFMPMFTDELASEITFNFVCVHDGLTKTVDATPEMASLNEILTPLYAINAISVQQLKDQLLKIKKDVETARAAILN